MKKSKRLVVANWKLNPSTLGDAKRLFLGIHQISSRCAKVEMVIAAPTPYINELRHLTKGKKTLLGAQNVSFLEKGPHTGEVSLSMLRSVGVSHVLVGHSERRAFGETDEEVHKKLKVVLKSGLTAILCVGESERDSRGTHFGFVESQLRTALSGIPRKALAQLVIAYEPVWAISSGDGRGDAATAEDAHEMSLFIRKVLSLLHNRTAAEDVRILYGGSVNAENAEAFIKEAEVDGFLVGGASLHVTEFGEILQIVNKSV